MSSILVIGARGQVGKEIQHLANKYPIFSFVFKDKEELDITDKKAVMEDFDNNDYAYCINCAAYTAVDKAESDVKIATAVNVDGAKFLAMACRKSGIPMIHFSTDYVYHSKNNAPFKETDKTSPKSVYAKTKLKGEKAAQKANPDTMIIRTSWVYSSFGHNFVKTMLRLGEERDALGIVFDQIGSPTYARDLADAVLSILNKVERGQLDVNFLRGIYHYSNEGVCSWYDFAQAIFEMEGIECNVKPIESIEYPTPAPRPPFSVLNKNKFKNVFGMEISHWRDSLIKCLQSMTEKELSN